jgi:hypothetical protein
MNLEGVPLRRPRATRVEAHDPRGEMFGLPRPRKLVAIHGAGSGEEFLHHLLEELQSFTGEDREQEDDIALVALHRIGV